MQHFNALFDQVCLQCRDPRYVSARSVETGYESRLHQINTAVDDNWNRRGGILGNERCRGPADGGNRDDGVMDQTGGYDRQPVILEFAPSVCDRDVSSFNKASLGHSLAEGGEKRRCVRRERSSTKVTDHWDRVLLRAGRKGPRND